MPERDHFGACGTFSMLDTPTVWCMSKVPRHVRKKDNEQEARTTESCLAEHKAILPMGGSISTLRWGLAEEGLKKVR